MKQSLQLVLLALALVNGGYCKMDQDFCQKHMGTKSATPIPLIEDTRNWQAIQELFSYTTADIIYSDLHYSVDNQGMSVIMSTADELVKTYVLLGPEVYLENSYLHGKGHMCTSHTLENSTLAKDLNIQMDKHGLPVLTPTRYMLSYSTINTPVYIGQTTMRGIKAQKWTVCAYQKWKQTTLVADIYYSSSGIRMPGSKDPAPLATVVTYKDSSGITYTERTDITRFIPKVELKDKAFEIPPAVWCADRPVANNLPKPADIFQFTAIQRNLGNINNDPAPKPSLKYLREIYSDLARLFVLDEEVAAGGDSLKKYRIRITHDYESGLEYDVNLSTGSCSVHKIELASADFNMRPDGTVIMKDPTQFFHLNESYNYQYMGVHHYFDRDIEANVFTAVVKGGTKANPTFTEYTWWYATENWMTNIMKFHKYYVMPLRLRIRRSEPADVIEMDIFEYQRKPSEKALSPDLSPCFAWGKELYLELLLEGRYDQIFLENPENFHYALKTAMLKYTALVNLLRITKLRVMPGDTGDTTVAKFTLLGVSNITGNVIRQIDEAPSDKIYTSMQMSIDTGKFILKIDNKLGQYQVKGLDVEREFTDPDSFKARHRLVNPSSSGFSDGAMGGLAVGMLLLGLIMGFGGYKGGKKYNDRVPDISMERLGNRS